MGRQFHRLFPLRHFATLERGHHFRRIAAASCIIFPRPLSRTCKGDSSRGVRVGTRGRIAAACCTLHAMPHHVERAREGERGGRQQRQHQPRLLSLPVK